MDKNIININYKTRGNIIKNKPKIFFCAHPKDFDKYFEEISEDVLDITNSVIYYKDKNNISSKNIINNLTQINLFIIPITWNFLSIDCDARIIEFKYALKHNIPILPILMEEGIDYYFNQQCGSLHSLNKTVDSKDQFRKKLKDYLNSVLVSDELIQQVKDAFDAYIFLSYRKKDRKYAEKIMHLIHENPFCRDIAIWYDEFLKPGYDFNIAIEEAIKKSKLFTLVVTPNLINEENYVKNIEYPYAKEKNKRILPIEAVKTNKQKLKKEYNSIPNIINVKNHNELSESLKKYLIKEAWNPNDDKKHLYFMGIAYVNGIDVEINYNMGISLLEKSANMEFIESIEKLVNIYRTGQGTNKNYKEAINWQEKLIELLKKHKRKNSYNILVQENKLAELYSEIGEYQKSFDITMNVYKILKSKGSKYQKEIAYITDFLVSRYLYIGEYNKALKLGLNAYELNKTLFGEKDKATTTLLSFLAKTYCKIGNYSKAIELEKKVYQNTLNQFGKDNDETFTILNNLSQYYFYSGNIEKSIEIEEKVFIEQKNKYNKENSIVLDNLGIYYSNIRKYEKALEMLNKATTLTKQELGNNHPHYLAILAHTADIYSHINQNTKAIQIMTEICKTCTDKFPKLNPTTLNYLHNLGLYYSSEKNYEKSIEIGEYVYLNTKKIFGVNHPNTISSLINLSTYYYNTKNYTKCIQLANLAYRKACKVFGTNHFKTLTIMNNLAIYYNINNNNKKAIEIGKKVYQLNKEKMGVNNYDTLFYLDNLIGYYEDDKKYNIALKLANDLYKAQKKQLGNNHKEIIETLNRIEKIKKKINN